MFTLVYLNGYFNRPDTLLPFLETNVGAYPLLQIDCVTPYRGTENDIISDVCNFLNSIDTRFEVSWNVTRNASTELKEDVRYVNSLEVQVYVSRTMQ